VIAVDTNILVYAFRESTHFHQAALACMNRLANGNQAWALPWPCVHEFLGVVTHPKIPPAAASMDSALAAIDAWMASPTLQLLAESETHWHELKAVLVAGRVRGPMVHDARIAALCHQHGVREFWTADRDFGRFPSLRTRNPLIDG
jgi:uncharacterized protein